MAPHGLHVGYYLAINTAHISENIKHFIRPRLPRFLLQPEEALGTGISAKNRSKIDDLWASMNKEDAPRGDVAGSSRDTGPGKAKGKKSKKKANKKANQVKRTPR